MWHDYNSNVLVYGFALLLPIVTDCYFPFSSLTFLFLGIKYACHLIRAQKSFFIVSFMDILQLLFFPSVAALLHVNACYLLS